MTSAHFQRLYSFFGKRGTTLKPNREWHGLTQELVQSREKSFVLLALLLLVLTRLALSEEPQVFGSFEDPAEVAAIRCSAGVQIKVSRRFAAWEGSSLEVVFPEKGGAIETARIPADWRRKESLLIFAWSLRPSELQLTLQDATSSNFNFLFQLRAGANHLQLPLSQVQGVNLQVLRSLRLSVREKETFYLDYFALDRFHPVLKERGRWDINYSMDVETPHVAWGRPFVNGPIKVFAIADVADGRGTIELAQRLDLVLKATTIGSSTGINKWGFGDFYEQRSSGGEFWKDAYSLVYTYVADDLIYGPAYDVILWPGVRPWDDYPADVRDALRKRVEEGAGLVIFSPFNRGNGLWDPSPLVRILDLKSEDPNNFYHNNFADSDHTPWKRTADHYITRNVPFDAFPWSQMSVPGSKARGEVLLETASGLPVLAVRNAGKGRVVAFGYSEKGMIPEINNVFETGIQYPYHEYLWSLVARAVVWAAKREPASSLLEIQCDASGATVTVDNPPPGSQLFWAIRNSFGELEVETSASILPASKKIQLEFPKRLSGGLHFLELHLSLNGRALDWAARTFSIPAKVTIQALKAWTDRVKVGDEIPVVVQLNSTRPIAARLSLRLLDNYDRILDQRQTETTIEGSFDQTFRLKTTGALTHLAKIDAEVSVDDLRSDRQTAEVFVLQPHHWDDYDIVMYRFGPDPIPGIWPKIDEQMRRLQVTTLSSYSVSHSKHANYNVQAQTRISGQESPDGPARNYYTAMKKKYLETGDKRVLVRQFCLDDPAYKELVRKELKDRTEPWIPFSPMSYYVYEEPSLTCYGDAVDICFSPYTLRAMRKWLQEVYGGLDRLNRQWGTELGDWESVVPDDAPEAQKRGNYASWADHRTYMERTYADAFAYVLGELRQLDPEGILLNSGTQISGSHNGCDYSRINRYTRHLNAYDDGNQLDFHRCFNPDLKISGGSGYGVLGKDVFYNLYDTLFKGANGGAYVFWQYSTIDPDLTMSQSGKDMEVGFQEIRGQGIGKLVGLSTPDNNGIAIHYSYPSIHGTWIVDGKIKEEVNYHTSPAFDRFNENRDGWVKILKDSGLQFDFIAYSDVEQGSLLAKGYKTLILPMSVALSDKEVEAVRHFVRHGGTIIADALPGIMDEHCTFRSSRVLLDIFGVDAPPGTREAILAAEGEPQLRLTSAHSLVQASNHSTLISHRFSQGRAYFLNYFLHTYPQDKLEGHTGEALSKMAMVLKDAGLNPKVRLTGTSGEVVADCATYLFNTGTTRLLGLVPDKKKRGPQRIHISFDGSSAIYQDVRRKQFLGNGQSFETETEPAIPRLFAMVERSIDGLELSGPPSARLGDNIEVEFAARGPQALRSVAKVVVINPQGKEIAYYGGNEDIVNGKGRTQFRTALNDPPGRWRVLVTEVISGKQADLEVLIQ
jgi:hypothetical protein